MSTPKKKIVIIGAGPTGLGAALRCVDLNHDEWLLIDQSETCGGLARSFKDEKGFTWDIGGHVIFSHYQYFDDVMDITVPEWYSHERESWVWVKGTWVPYPFQNNIHRLPNESKTACIEGLIDVHNLENSKPPKNFEEYFHQQFGPGICELFMSPYNKKVWAVPPKMLSTEWMGERVATVDVKRVIRNIINNTDDLGWGPNATFRFPKYGGTGAIWDNLGKKLPQDKMKLGSSCKVTSIDAKSKQITLKSGEIISYDALISTMPFDDLITRIDKNDELFDGTQMDGASPQSMWSEIAKSFVYSSTHVIGIGIRGTPPPHLKTKCWMYFPEATSPFYRATVFSNYSDKNAPDGHWSLMVEVSEHPTHKPVQNDKEAIIDECITGCLNSNLLTATDEIVSRWYIRFEKGYPTPFLGRNDLLSMIQPSLKANGIYSRGRFGGWKYEVANMDHSMMQGVEAVEDILGIGKELTYYEPSTVNATKEMTRRLNLKLLNNKL